MTQEILIEMYKEDLAYSVLKRSNICYILEYFNKLYI